MRARFSDETDQCTRARTLSHATSGAGAVLIAGNACDEVRVIRSRAFAQRAEAIGLRYNAGARIDGYNFSQGRAISVAVFRSEGTE